MATIYSGLYNNHNIKLENSISKCSLFIDGEEKDAIRGLVVRDKANVLRASFTEGEEDYVVEVMIDIVSIKRGLIINPVGHRFVIKINSEFLATGFISGRQQRKYGKLLENENNFKKIKK